MRLTIGDVPCDGMELRNLVTTQEAEIRRLQHERDVAQVRHLFDSKLKRADTGPRYSPI